MKITCALFLLGYLCHQISARVGPNMDNNDFILIKLSTNWYDAHRGCRIRKMHLASISDETDNDNIKKIIPLDDYGYWTSGTNLGTNRTSYVWTGNGLPFTYTNWKEPPRTGGNNCLAYLETGYWLDTDCSGFKRYICQYDSKPKSVN